MSHALDCQEVLYFLERSKIEWSSVLRPRCLWSFKKRKKLDALCAYLSPGLSNLRFLDDILCLGQEESVISS